MKAIRHRMARLPLSLGISVGMSLGLWGITAISQESAAQAASIDSLSIWVAPGYGGSNPTNLSDWFSNVSLFIDDDGDNQLAGDSVKSGAFGSSGISATKTGQTYTAPSGAADIWKVDFTGLGLNLPDNKTVRFGVKAIGSAIPGGTPGNFANPVLDGSDIAAINNPDFYPFFLLAVNPGATLPASAFGDGKYAEYQGFGANAGNIFGLDFSGDLLVEVRDAGGNLLTDRSLATALGAGGSLSRWAPPESIYSYQTPFGPVGGPGTARFKGDDFNTVPTPSLLIGVIGTGLSVWRKRRQQAL